MSHGQICLSLSLPLSSSLPHSGSNLSHSTLKAIRGTIAIMLTVDHNHYSARCVLVFCFCVYTCVYLSLWMFLHTLRPSLSLSSLSSKCSKVSTGITGNVMQRRLYARQNLTYCPELYIHTQTHIDTNLN